MLHVSGAVISTGFSGPCADAFGRKAMLASSACLFLTGKRHPASDTAGCSTALALQRTAIHAKHHSKLFVLAGEALGGWSPCVAVLAVGRVLTGLGIGLIATTAPLHISECSPPSIRGQLSTLPQLMGIAAMILSYLAVFLLSMQQVVNWRLMLGLG